MIKQTHHIYLERRETPTTPNTLASDIARHWRCRFAHSKALVMTSEPEVLVKQLEKQWLRLTNQLQQKRLQTVGADEILELTYAITRMQHIRFVASEPHARPNAHVWLITSPQQLTGEFTSACRSLYVTSAHTKTQLEGMLEHVASHALVVDYAHNSWPTSLQPKTVLEQKVHDAWAELHTFFKQQHINIASIINGDSYNVEQVDNAIDVLLDVSGSFLRHAHQFQEVLQLAEPLQIAHAVKQQYEAANLLARRVAALSPNVFSRFISQALDDETFYLQDRTLEVFKRESLHVTISHHYRAGRNNLARALERAFMEGSAAAQ